MESIRDISSFLRDNGIKPSFQRIKIFRYLVEKKNHPTVDIIYKDLKDDIPTLSKTTIYNTLKLFSEKKIVLVVNIENNIVRYDVNTSFHGHFKCEKCGEVYDFELKKEDVNIKEIKNLDINEILIYVKGICENCRT